MNIDTGQIYTNEKEIADAKKRGERLTPLSQEEFATLNGMNRHERRRRLAEMRKEQKKATKRGLPQFDHVSV